MSTDTNQHKSQLAKLLATENISFQHSPSAKTAYFDIKKRLLVLPVWENISPDLYDMLVVHEVGHALDTPVDDWVDGINDIAVRVHGKQNARAENSVKHFMNVIEDARIDKRQKRRYPGSRRNYVVGYKELIQRDFFGTSKHSLNDMSFIDRLNIHFKGGAMLGIKFSPEETVLLRKVENAETFAEVLALTEEIYRFAKMKAEEEKNNRRESDLSDGDEESEDGEGIGISSFDDMDDDGDGNDEDEFSSSSASASSDASSDDNDDQEDIEAGKTGADAGSSDIIPEVETEKEWEQRIKSIVKNEDCDYVYVDIPTVNVEHIVHDYKRVLNERKNYYMNSFSPDWRNSVRRRFLAFRNEENATISFMVKEFEMKKAADIHARVSVAKTGVIDTNKLHSYKFNDDIFRRLATVPTGKNHGFVMFVDGSGSMAGNWEFTIKQLVSLTMFCRRVQIPFDVYLFRDPCQNGEHGNKQFNYKPGTMMLDQVILRNILSSRMNASELNLAYEMFFTPTNLRVDALNGTPLNSAIVAAIPVVNAFRKKHKLEVVNTIFLTDGDSKPIMSVVSSDNQMSRMYRRKHFIIRDDKMKKEYAMPKNVSHLSSADDAVTSALLKILHDHTGSNLIGFFIQTPYGFGTTLNRYVPENRREEARKSWSSNKFVAINTAGYDQYYVINVSALKTNDANLKIEEGMTRGRIAQAFSRFSEKKTVNRVLLRQFIEKIAKVHK